MSAGVKKQPVHVVGVVDRLGVPQGHIHLAHIKKKPNATFGNYTVFNVRVKSTKTFADQSFSFAAHYTTSLQARGGAVGHGNAVLPTVQTEALSTVLCNVQ